jgi:GntR family transcriptional repressor for pyruvate dehydrogenase complex
VKAYELVAGRLREQILEGVLEEGCRLPKETVLADEFGVSRATIREALRLLAAQGLIRTAKGAGGGSFVTVPSAGHLSESLRSGIGLLTTTDDLTLEELLEARELLEVPAARLAARRRTEEDLLLMQTAIPDRPLHLPTQEQFVYNRDFHSCVIAACGNTLVSIAAQPVFWVLQTHLSRSRLGRAWHRSINDHHRAIAAAIESGDERGAGEQMHEHLVWLRPYYEKAWRSAGRATVVTVAR